MTVGHLTYTFKVPDVRFRIWGWNQELQNDVDLLKFLIKVSMLRSECHFYGLSPLEFSADVEWISRLVVLGYPGWATSLPCETAHLIQAILGEIRMHWNIVMIWIQGLIDNDYNIIFWKTTISVTKDLMFIIWWGHNDLTSAIGSQNMQSWLSTMLWAKSLTAWGEINSQRL